MLGGTSAIRDAEADTPAAEPSIALPPRDLNFVGEVVQGEAWSDWGERFSNLEDLVARVRERLAPGQKVRRLAIASYSAEHTSGYMAFDTGLTSRERIDGLNQTPIKADVATKLAQLRPLLADDGVVELRVAGIGQGEHGLKALTSAAAILGVPVRGPLEKAIALAPSRGLIADWITVYPPERSHPPVISGWRERSLDGSRPVEAAYAPVPGQPAPANQPETATGLVFVTEPAAAWAPGAQRVAGIADLVDRAVHLSEGRPITRFAVVSMGSTLYDGFVAFDRGEGESVDGNIREEPDYPHLQVMFQRVRDELRRLRPHLAPAAEIELRVARLGVGDAGRRALQKIADEAGAAVRAPAGTVGELKATRGLITRWITVWPTSFGLPPVESAWRETSEPASSGPWLAIEPTAFAPIRGVEPPLPRGAVQAAAPVADPVAQQAPADPALVLTVRCSECNRRLDEAPSTALRARQPCPSCGSLARRQAYESAPRRRSRLGQLFRRPSLG